MKLFFYKIGAFMIRHPAKHVARALHVKRALDVEEQRPPARFGVQGLRVAVLGFGFWVQGLGFGV